MANESRYISRYTGRQIDHAYETIEAITSDDEGKVVGVDANGKLKAVTSIEADIVDVQNGTGHYEGQATDVQSALEEVYDMASTGGVTGVKGNAEENYRQGNVNITPSDIGAQPTLTFDNTPTANSNNPVKSGGIKTYVDDAVNNAVEIAEGKTKAYVISDAAVSGYSNDIFNSTNATITYNNGETPGSIIDVNGNIVNFHNLKIGDIIYVAETDVPDRWVGSITYDTVVTDLVQSITFYASESKINIATSVIENDTRPVSSGAVYTALHQDIGYVELDSGAVPPDNLTDAQLAEISKKYCIIKRYGGDLFYKVNDDYPSHSEIIVFQGNISVGVGNNTANTSFEYILVNPTTSSKTAEGVTVPSKGWNSVLKEVILYSKQQTDTLLSDKYELPSGGIPYTDMADVGYVELSNDSGTLTDAQYAETQKKYCIINKTNKIFLKTFGSTSQSGFSLYDVGLSSNQPYIQEAFITVANSTKNYTSSASTANVYNRTYIDTELGKKYTKPSGGIPKTDLATAVQTSLDKADSSVQGVSYDHNTKQLKQTINGVTTVVATINERRVVRLNSEYYGEGDTLPNDFEIDTGDILDYYDNAGDYSDDHFFECISNYADDGDDFETFIFSNTSRTIEIRRDIEPDVSYMIISIKYNVNNTLTSTDTQVALSAAMGKRLQDEKQGVINSNNKLSADYVDDTSTTHKFVSASEKTTWNSKQNALTFDPEPVTNSINPVESGGIKTYVDRAVNNAIEIAEGKTNNYVISDANPSVPADYNWVNNLFNTTNATIYIPKNGDNGEPNYIKQADNTAPYIKIQDLKTGDIISITETDVPDRWSVPNYDGQSLLGVTFYPLETKLNMATSVTSGDTRPVTSGAVYTALHEDIGYVELNVASSSLTDAQIAEIQKKYCIIKFSGATYYKCIEDYATTELTIFQSLSQCVAGSGQISQNFFYIVANTTTSSKTYGTDTIEAKSWLYTYSSINFYSKAQADTLLSAKQDTISDLATIRSGAAAGATAVQPGDLSTEVWTFTLADGTTVTKEVYIK